MRLRNGTSSPPIDPENDDITSVAPAIRNQVLTSWLLATSPRSWASSSRFCVGSCVFSDASSSAMASSALSGPYSGSCSGRYSDFWHQVVHDADEVIHE